MTRRWTMRNDSAVDSPRDPEFSRLNLPPLVERVLRVRGFDDPAVVEHFCEPKLTDLHDPALMPGIDIAAERIITAIHSGQQIVIYGDYDVDGITATAILYHTIRAAQPSANVRTYIPHRLDEGYGLNEEALRQLRTDGADLVISVDCGITASGPAKIAREIGLDLIITDHHDITGDESQLPQAVALVHPRLPGSQYPFGELCGAGVAFKLAWRFATEFCGSQRVSDTMQKTLIDMLPLVALGTIADVVPLVGENRILAAFGLRRIRQTQLPGLRALLDSSSLAGENIDSEKVGFVLGPRLNACGRMGHAAEAVHLLTDATPQQAAEIAQSLSKFNAHRQSVERTIVEHACRMAEDAGLLNDDHRALVLAHESWHPGVLGIACSRLVDKFSRPTILLNLTRDACRGSGRSIDGFNLSEALHATGEHLSTHGGHAAAAGLSLPAENLEAFTSAFLDYALQHISPDMMVPNVTIDCDAELSELDQTTVQRLLSLSPFGRGNAKPVVRLSNVTVAEAPRQMGKQGQHLSVRLRQEHDGQTKWIRSIWWRNGQLAQDFVPGMSLDVVVEPKLNTFNGRTSVEVELCDVLVRETGTS